MNKPVGIRKDHIYVEQPKTSARNALNARIVNGNYTNDKGNSFVTSVPLPVIADLTIEEDKILFCTDGKDSEIGRFSNGVYTSLINTPDLKFHLSPYIESRYRVIRGCEEVIYFVDSVNPDRSINLSQLDNYKDENGDWLVDEMSLQANFTFPQFDSLEVSDSGGFLFPGSYFFFAEVLDESLNSIGISDISDQVIIYDEPTYSSYNLIDGAVSALFDGGLYAEQDGGVAKTNKSIIVRLSNVDTNYKYVRLYVLIKDEAKNTNKFYQIKDTIPITDSTVTYRYTGIADTDVITDLEKVLVDNKFYETSKTIEIVDRRLVRANLKSKTIDFSGFQRAVNEITSEPVINKVKADQVVTGNSKYPVYNNISFQSDEVYAFGIVFIFKNGYVSPVFHIPGKEATTFDTRDLLVGTDIAEKHVRHLNIQSGETVKSWKVINSGTSVSMGYYETETTYPLIKDCDDQYIFGDLAGKPIRHHKFPSRKWIGIASKDSDGDYVVHNLGIKFDNITYPHSDIIGHKIVMVPRKDESKSVLDSGIAVGYSKSKDTTKYAFYTPQNEMQDADELFFFLSPKSLFGINNRGNHIEIITNYYKEITNQYNESYKLTDTENTNVSVLEFAFRPTAYYTNPSTYSYNNFVFADRKTLLNAGLDKPIYNYSSTNTANAVILDDPVTLQNKITGDTNLQYIYNKQTVNPYNNLFNLIYRSLNSKIYTLSDDNTFFNGDVFISELKYYDLYAGDEDGDNIADRKTLIRASYLRRLYVESEVNYSMRYGGTDDCTRIYKPTQSLTDYTNNKISVLEDNDTYDFRESICTEFYAYNIDYNKYYESKAYLPLPFTYNYCSECQSKFPNSIVWSSKGFPEDIIDNFRIYQVNNIVTVGENTGEIVDIAYYQDRLLTKTTTSCHLSSPNPRTINTSADTAYIGTGDFLSVPSIEFAQTTYGFGGQQNTIAAYTSEKGHTWIDEKAGRIFHYNRQLVELSSEEFGMQNWLNDWIPQTSVNFLSYDPQDNRLFIKTNDFMLSYAFNDQAFESFYDYNPTWMFNVRKDYYSIKDNKIYKHSDNIINQYFEQPFTFSIEYVINALETTTLETLAYYAQTISNNADIKYPSFNYLVVYTENQSTGLIELVNKPLYAQPWSNSKKTLVHAEENYRIAGIRDISNSNEVFDEDFYTINVKNVNYNKQQWELIPLRNKYFIVTLIASHDKKIIFNVAESTNKKSIL